MVEETKPLGQRQKKKLARAKREAEAAAKAASGEAKSPKVTTKKSPKASPKASPKVAGKKTKSDDPMAAHLLALGGVVEYT